MVLTCDILHSVLCFLSLSVTGNTSGLNFGQISPCFLGFPDAEQWPLLFSLSSSGTLYRGESTFQSNHEWSYCFSVFESQFFDLCSNSI